MAGPPAEGNSTASNDVEGPKYARLPFHTDWTSKSVSPILSLVIIPGTHFVLATALQRKGLFIANFIEMAQVKVIDTVIGGIVIPMDNFPSMTDIVNLRESTFEAFKFFDGTVIHSTKTSFYFFAGTAIPESEFVVLSSGEHVNIYNGIQGGDVIYSKHIGETMQQVYYL